MLDEGVTQLKLDNLEVLARPSCSKGDLVFSRDALVGFASEIPEIAKKAESYGPRAFHFFLIEDHQVAIFCLLRPIAAKDGDLVTIDRDGTWLISSSELGLRKSDELPHGFTGL